MGEVTRRGWGNQAQKEAGLGSHGRTRTNTDGHGQARFSRLVSSALLGAQAVEALGEAALFQERLFQGGELAIQKIATHVQEGERGIGDELGGGGHGRTRTSTDEHGRTWTCLGGGHYGPLSFVLYPGLDLVNGGAAPGLKAEERGVPWRPLFKTPVPEKVLVVAAEFLETGAGDVGELELGLFRSAAGLASLGDVFAAAARGLNHLVVRAAAPVKVTVAETHGHVVDQLREVKAFQVPITAVRGDQFFGAIHADLLTCEGGGVNIAPLDRHGLARTDTDGD